MEISRPGPGRLPEDLRIPVGGSLGEGVGEIFAHLAETLLGFERASVRTIPLLNDFVDCVTRERPHLIVVYLHGRPLAPARANDPDASCAVVAAEIASDLGRTRHVTNCGLQLVAYLRGISDAPVIVLTGDRSDAATVARTRSAGAAAYWPLPLDLRTCIDELRHCLLRPSTKTPT